jgi:hypothetical protein
LTAESAKLRADLESSLAQLHVQIDYEELRKKASRVDPLEI